MKPNACRRYRNAADSANDFARPAEKTAIVETALQQPDLSPRELACHLTDHAGFTVSEASVYRVLKQYRKA